MKTTTRRKIRTMSNTQLETYLSGLGDALMSAIRRNKDADRRNDFAQGCRMLAVRDVLLERISLAECLLSVRAGR